MCGIAGFVAGHELPESAEASVRCMMEAIARRGPDDSGAWVDRAGGVALGHRRLAIIDLSPTGHQPMTSDDGRLVMVYNGEIYNFRELRSELESSGRAPNWKGSSDSEVLLAAIAAWGVGEALRRASGMFAIALWDRRERSLTLARDRMGEKPLYYGWQGVGEERRFLFGSELGALRMHPSWQPSIDTDALGMLLRYLYIPEPHSIYRDIRKLMPGTFVVVDPVSEREETTVYWDMLAIAAEASANPFQGSPDEAVDALEGILGGAVERQMVADVSLGAFLSGGVDSSTIVALMQARSSRPVKTFTIGFTEKNYDESAHARAVATHLGSDHVDLILTPAEAQAVIPDLPTLYSEPFADSSQIPTYLVSRLARENVTVSLSGDAGDELFGGYNRYFYAHRYWKHLSRIPQAVRGGLSSLMTRVSPDMWDRAATTLLRRPAFHVGNKIHKSAGVLKSGTIDELYLGLIAINPRADALVRQPTVADPFAQRNLAAVEDLGPIERMMALDAVHYLPGDILTKVDRAAMGISLESRIPMLDPEVIRFAWSLPIDMKIRDGVTKWPLRELLYRHVPRSLIERPKMGFGIPIGDWLRGALREWGESLLNHRCIVEAGLFDPREVQRLWAEHQSGARNNQHQLWPVLMVQAWIGQTARIPAYNAQAA